MKISNPIDLNSKEIQVYSLNQFKKIVNKLELIGYRFSNWVEYKAMYDSVEEELKNRKEVCIYKEEHFLYWI